MAGYKVSKTVSGNNCNGTTKKIRDLLSFTDEKKWKKFSNRRLELIDKFGLSERKASEQDDNIKQIATILRTEFGYPLSSASEFEKLVTAAVQSVRRNRKRSKKRLPGGSTIGNTNFTTTGSSEDEPVTRGNSPLPISGTPILPQLSKIGGHGPVSPSVAVPLPSIQPKGIPSVPQSQRTPAVTAAALGGLTRSSAIPTITGPVTQSSYHLDTQQGYTDIIKAIIGDVVNNVVSLNEQSQKDQQGESNLTEFALSLNDQHLLSLGLHSKRPTTKKSQANNTTEVPFFLREKLLLTIQRSRTCFDMAHSQGSIDLHSTLEILGEMAIRSSIAFVIERFFSNLMPSSMEYITTKASSQESLSLLSVKIFGAASKRNLSHLPPSVQTKLLYLIIGGLIKDFGFDPCLYPLSEIVHHVVMNQYPLLTNSTILPQKSGPNSDASQRITVLSTLPMKPQVANEDVNKKVTIKFKDREQAFTFHLLSNGPPTVSEILENCKSLFHIISQTKQLSLYHNNSIVRDDVELAKLFNSFSNECIILEVKEASNNKDEQNDGLKILSDASLQIKQEITKNNSSLDAFDKIINRIGSFSKNSENTVQPSIIPSNKPSVQSQLNNGGLPSLPSVVTNRSGGNNYLSNNNLPQSVFQPLL